MKTTVQFSFFLALIVILNAPTNSQFHDYDDDIVDPIVAAASSGVDWSSRLSAPTTPSTVPKRQPVQEERPPPPQPQRNQQRRPKPRPQPQALAFPEYAPPQGRSNYQPQSSASVPKVESQAPRTSARAQGKITRKPNQRRQAAYEPAQNAAVTTLPQPSFSAPAPLPALNAFPPQISVSKSPGKRVVVVKKMAPKPAHTPPPPPTPPYLPPQLHATPQFRPHSPAPQYLPREPPHRPTTPRYPLPQQNPFFVNRDGYAPTQGPYTNYGHDDGHYSEIRDQVLDSSDEAPSRQQSQTDEPYFSPPKFDLANSKLNEKGCKMVIKELKQVPRDMLEAHGSNPFGVFRSKRSPREDRRLSSIIMTKECYYPDASSAPDFEKKYYNSQDRPNNNNNKPERSSYSNRPSQSKPNVGYAPYPSHDSQPRQETSHRSREQPFPVPQEQYKPHRQESSSPRKKPSTSSPRSSQDGEYSGSDSRYSSPYFGPDHSDSREFDDGFRGSAASASNLEGGLGGYDHGYDGFPAKFEEGFGHGGGGFGNYGAHDDSHGGHGSHTNHGPHEDRGSSGSGHREQGGKKAKQLAQASHSGQGGRAQTSHSGQGGGRAQASGQHRQRAGPTPKMVNRTYQFYKKDNGKEGGDPHNKENAEEYGTGYFKSFSTDYDSTRDGPRDGQRHH